jgi:SET domain-containing protein
MYKNKLFNNLKNDVYCRIKPSKTHGVGVFAIKDIPKGVNPFRVSSGECLKHRVIGISKKDFDKLDNSVKQIVDDYYHTENDIYYIPYDGPNANDISYYMNMSKSPNIGFIDKNGCNMVIFVAVKKIKKGEELFIDYSKY